MRTWTDEEIRILLENYNRVSNERLSQLIPNKTRCAIYKRAYKMGLRKTKEIEFVNRSAVRKGEKSANWKGGTRKTSRGYMQILVPGHPRADAAGYVMEHILVWEKETGIPVPSNCCIHHLNGIKTDNRISNLCIMQFAAHTVYHHTGQKRSEETKQKIRERKIKNVP